LTKGVHFLPFSTLTLFCHSDLFCHIFSSRIKFKLG
jgi:hypothetical protein